MFHSGCWESCVSLTVACTLLCEETWMGAPACVEPRSELVGWLKEEGDKRKYHTTFSIHPKNAGCVFVCVSAARFCDVGISYRDSCDGVYDGKFKSAACVVSSLSSTPNASMMCSDYRDSVDSAENIVKSRALVEPEVGSSGCCSEVRMLKEPSLTLTWLSKNSLLKRSQVSVRQLVNLKRLHIQMCTNSTEQSEHHLLIDKPQWRCPVAK